MIVKKSLIKFYKMFCGDYIVEYIQQKVNDIAE